MACGRYQLARSRKKASRKHGSPKSTTYEEINALEICCVCGEGRRLEVSLKHSHQVTEEFAVLHHQRSNLDLGENISAHKLPQIVVRDLKHGPTARGAAEHNTTRPIYMMKKGRKRRESWILHGTLVMKDAKFIHATIRLPGSSGEVLLTRLTAAQNHHPDQSLGMKTDNPPHRGRSSWGFWKCFWTGQICMALNDQSYIIVIALHLFRVLDAKASFHQGFQGTRNTRARFQEKHASRQKRKNSTSEDMVQQGWYMHVSRVSPPLSIITHACSPNKLRIKIKDKLFLSLPLGQMQSLQKSNAFVI